MRIPWKLKSVAFSVADRIGPKPLYLAQKYLTGRSAVRFKAINRHWIFHRDNIEKHGARSVIEFGAGKNLAQNLYLFAELGIEQTLVDLNPMLDLALVNAAIDGLSALGVAMNGHVRSPADLEASYRIRYVAPLDMRSTPFEGDTFDACISTATLEHIPKQVIEGIWGEVARILKPAGMVSAVIDYGDHYARTDKTIPDLHFLRFTEEEWRRYNHACHYQNRLRHRHHMKLLEEAGFKLELAEAQVPAPPVPGAHQNNLTGDASDFCVVGHIVGRVTVS